MSAEATATPDSLGYSIMIHAVAEWAVVSAETVRGFEPDAVAKCFLRLATADNGDEIILRAVTHILAGRIVSQNIDRLAERDERALRTDRDPLSEWAHGGVIPKPTTPVRAKDYDSAPINKSPAEWPATSLRPGDACWLRTGCEEKPGIVTKVTKYGTGPILYTVEVTEDGGKTVYGAPTHDVRKRDAESTEFGSKRTASGTFSVCAFCGKRGEWMRIDRKGVLWESHPPEGWYTAGNTPEFCSQDCDKRFHRLEAETKAFKDRRKRELSRTKRKDTDES